MLNHGNTKQRSNGNTVSIYAVGDVLTRRPNAELRFQLCASTLAQADIRFCNQEATLSRKTITPDHCRLPADRVSGLRAAGFDVVSLNNNGMEELGDEGVLETMNIVRENGMQPVGVGKNIDEARKPVIIERNGTRIAFLAYNSLAPAEYWATKGKPGGAPLRALTFFEQPVGFRGPKSYTYPDRDDLGAMREDIKKARAQSDVVIVSWHAGIMYTRAVLAECQSEISHEILDAGADVLVSSHAHILKGIEIYKGKVIFYGLGDFTIDSLHTPEELASPGFKSMLAKSGLTMKPDDLYLGHHPPESRKTMIANIMITNKKVDRVSFLPVLNTREMQPEVMKHGTKGFDEIFQWVNGSTREVGFNTQFKVEGDEIVVVT